MRICYKELQETPVSTLTNADNVELETALQQLLLNLRCDAVKTDMASWVHRRLSGVSICHGCHCCESVREKLKDSL